MIISEIEHNVGYPQVTAHQPLSVIIRNQAKLMSVPELVPGNRTLSLAIEISLTPLQLISVGSSEGSESSSGQLIQPRRPKGCTAEGMPGVKPRSLKGWRGAAWIQPTDERVPLPSLLRIAQEFLGQSKRNMLRDSDSAPLERCADSVAQDGHFEGPGVGHEPDVVEVLHAAVANIQHNHCIEFFRNGGFAWIRTDDRAIQREQHWKRSPH